MKHLIKLTAMILIAALLLTGAASAITVVDRTSEYYVADYADVLSAETENYIVEMNRKLDELTGGQIVVVSIEFLGGQNIEEYAYTLMNEWKIGDAEKNNGLLLLLVTGEANYWAMSGSGIQSSLTASLLGEYLSTYLEPDFKALNYDAGVTKVFDQFLGWYERYYKVELSDKDTTAAQTGSDSTAPSDEQNDPLNEPTGIQKGGIIGKIAGWFLIIVLVLAVLAVLLVAVPRMIYLRRRGYRPNILSRTFWSSNPPPPPSRTRQTTQRSGGARMGTGGVTRGGVSQPREPGVRPRMGTGGSHTDIRTTSNRSVGGRTVGPQSGRSGGGTSRGGGAGRSTR